MYLLGSLIFSMFVGSPLTATLIDQLPKEKHPLIWRGTYEEITPDLVVHFDNVLDQVVSAVPEHVAHDILTLIHELANPDVHHRGNVRNPRLQFSLETYISRIDRLANVARIKVGRNI